MIDTHCHLADRKFAEDLDAVLERAREAGVDRMITIGDGMEESRRCVELAEKHRNVFCAVGVHPHNTKQWKEGDLHSLRLMAEGSKKVRAIGEIGLDYHYDFSPREVQKRVFEDQLKLAKEINISSVVHNRESIGDLRDIIGRVAPQKLVLHCCTEEWKDVEPLVRQGYFLSFTGIATYPSAGNIRETIRLCPLERMMVETDAPYLAPGPFRGQRNEPAYVTEVATLIAEIKGVSPEEVERITTKNAEEFFGL
ncbi:MAG: TatD family hydrolase [Candidatus Peribacteraceae bacterium]|jgi:TatD DNase family protein